MSSNSSSHRGYISFLSLIINDNEILEKADKIVVINENYQSEEFVNKRKGIVTSDFSDGRSEELIITLLDKAGNVLFYSKGRRSGDKVIDRINDLKKHNKLIQNTEPLESQAVLKRLQ